MNQIMNPISFLIKPILLCFGTRPEWLKIKILTFLLLTITIINGCSLLFDDIIVDNGDGIYILFDEGLHQDPKFQLDIDSNGFYILKLNSQSHQTIQRISVRIMDGNGILDSSNYYRIEWKSNLYWWLLEGSTVASITYTYINPFTGRLEYVNLPPLINPKDVLVPTINKVSMGNRGSTIISPINEMRGDTMKVTATYTHQITERRKGDSFFNIIGYKDISETVYIILE